MDKVLEHWQVFTSGQHQALRRLAVAPGASDLLAVVLDGLGQVEVHHLADIGLVDAHAEGDGGDDAGQASAHEVRLQSLAGLTVEPGVVGGDLEPGGLEVGRQAFGALLQGDVDNGAAVAESWRQPTGQMASPVVGGQRGDGKVQIGAVEAGGDDIVRRDIEASTHVIDDLGRGGGGQQQHLVDAELPAIVGQFLVVRAKIMSPFRQAVGLVDHHQGDPHVAQEGAKAFIAQAFDRYHQHLELAVAGRCHDLPSLIAILTRIDAGGGDTARGQRRQLVLHQRQ